MKALRTMGAVVAGALLAGTGMLVPLAAPAGAALAEGCTFSTNPSSGGSQSALRVACNFPIAANVPASNVISDFSNAVWHNGAARAVNGVAYDGGALLGNLTVVASPNAHFTAADVNRQISGTIGSTAIGSYTNIKVVLSANAVALNMPATTTGVSGLAVEAGLVVDAKVENSSIRAGIGAVTTPNSSAVTTGINFVKPSSGNATSTKSAPAWNAGDVGKQIVSTKLTGGSGFIASVSSGVATLSTTATASATSQTATVNTLGMVISPTLGFAASDVGRTIAGTPLSFTGLIPNKILSTGTVSSAMSNAIAGSEALVGFTYAAVSGTVVVSAANLSETPAYPNQITVGADEIVSSTRILSIDGSDYSINAGNGRIEAPAGTFRGSDKGLPVAGCGIYTGANGTNSPDTTGQNYITDVALNGAWAELAGGAYGTSPACDAFSTYGINTVIGLPSASAPLNGDVASVITSTLNLSPALVPGTDACATATYEGTTIMGQWYNPGSLGASLGGQQSVSLSSSFVPSAIKAPSNTIGGIKYPTAVVSFWAFVSQRVASETIKDKTFAAGTTKISLPWVPTLLALCEGTGISSEYMFSGTTIGTQSVPTGTGRPTTPMRGLRSGAIGGDVAYQPTTTAAATTVWTGKGTFPAKGALGQGVVAKLTLKP